MVGQLAGVIWWLMDCVRMSTAAKVFFTPALFTLITSTRQPTACRSEDITDTNKRQKVRMKQEVMLANKSFLLTDSRWMNCMNWDWIHEGGSECEKAWLSCVTTSHSKQRKRAEELRMCKIDWWPQTINATWGCYWDSMNSFRLLLYFLQHDEVKLSSWQDGGAKTDRYMSFVG